MKIRLATEIEAERLWFIRNQAIRTGCQQSFDANVITAWTPEHMPDSYRLMVKENPFFVAVNDHDEAIATGFLNLKEKSVDATFTLPEYMGCGAAGLIIAAIKKEALRRNIKQLTLESTPNAEAFYQKHGFISQGPGNYYSALAAAYLPSINMAISL